ncbi:hypothetical protein T03_4026 [Trichinella britovi]|uniref:Uncharacterized protein n=1 Tax=Trichinella britovi TaxID=45882 RepID=A0A0V1C618_TRIBR|nr:hypothetical protein T03_4026 [Trichinella britovi]
MNIRIYSNKTNKSEYTDNSYYKLKHTDRNMKYWMCVKGKGNGLHIITVISQGSSFFSNL